MDAGLSYRESAVAGASPIRLVILLYQQAIEDLRRALQALAAGDVEERTRQINHAMQVIGHLRATVDLERGGIVAKNLTHFYAQVIQRLMEAQCQQSSAILEQEIGHLMLVCDAWSGVEQSITVPGDAPPDVDLRRTSGDWSA